MELLRIVAMVMVLVLHADYLALGRPTAEELTGNTLSTLTRIGFEAACIVGVNVFVMISGWFGIRASWRGLRRFALQVAYCTVVIGLAAWLADGCTLPVKSLVKDMICANKGYWFVPAYLGLYMLSPGLNAMSEKLTRWQLGLTVLALMAMSAVYGFLLPTANYSGGYSTFAFCGLYLLARYVRAYGLKLTEESIWLIITTLSLNIGVAVVSTLTGFMPWAATSYVNPLNILMALGLVVAFSRLKFRSRLVNTVAASAFSVYLIHINTGILRHYLNWFRGLWADFSGMACLGLFALSVAGVYLACTLLDQPRRMLSKRLMGNG